MIAAMALVQSLVGVGPAAAHERIVRGDPGPLMVFEVDTDQVDRVTGMRDVAGAVQFEPGIFAGFRLRIALGGNRNQPKLRAGLTLAPTLHHRVNQGAPEINFGEGLEFGHRTGHRFSLSAAGHDIDTRRLGADGDNENGLPDWALIAGGVVIVAGVGGLLFFDALRDASE